MAIIIQLHEVAMIILFRTDDTEPLYLQFHFRINDTPAEARAEGSSLLAASYSTIISSLSYHADYRFILSIREGLYCDLY